MLNTAALARMLQDWMDAWNRHDLAGVLNVMAEDISFEHWNGRIIRGKRNLERAWRPWFESHANFRFQVTKTFIDEAQQTVIFEWQLHWPSPEISHEGRPELRFGIDIIQLRAGAIITKKTYIKTVVFIDDRKNYLKVEPL